MVATDIRTQLVQHIDQLTPENQERLLELVRTMERTQLKGTPGHELLKLAGTMSKEDADELQAIIDEGCGQVDPHGW